MIWFWILFLVIGIIHLIMNITDRDYSGIVSGSLITGLALFGIVAPIIRADTMQERKDQCRAVNGVVAYEHNAVYKIRTKPGTVAQIQPYDNWACVLFFDDNND